VNYAWPAVRSEWLEAYHELGRQVMSSAPSPIRSEIQ